jgi:L-aminopeptidase/D-esterase-like protein
MNRSLTAVPGLTVGHAQDHEAATGCTAIVGPFAASVEVFGLATGSRELDALSPFHLVPECDAILLTGGSAFGLSAADGVVAWLEEQGRGYQTRAARVPIVPAAVIYDLGVGRPDVRPGPEMGRRAARAATADPVAEGRVGAGTGATVGKLMGPGQALPAGVGSWAEPGDDFTVGALAVVNAFGDVLDDLGNVLAGCRDPSGGFADTAAVLRSGTLPGPPRAGVAENTTLAVVATDLKLDKRQLRIVAGQASAAFSRRISPAGTPFDGDTLFALSTGLRDIADLPIGVKPPAGSDDDARLAEPMTLLAIALRAQAALERAIQRAVADHARTAPPGGTA